MLLLFISTFRYCCVCVLLLLTTSVMAQDYLALSSVYLPQQDSVLVIVPQNYTSSSTKTYKTVFLLHGWSGNFRQWSTITNLQSYADQYGFIIVCPDGLYDTWYVNSPVQPNIQYEDFFFKDLYPVITKKYRTDTQNIFISGLSMGGYGAFSLFLAQPQLFRSVAATSALFDVRSFAKRFGLSKTFGNYDATKWAAYSLTEQVRAWKDKDKPIFFDCGKADLFFSNNQEMYQLCKSLGINVFFKEQDGSHDKRYWAKSIANHFEFFAKL